MNRGVVDGLVVVVGQVVDARTTVAVTVSQALLCHGSTFGLPRAPRRQRHHQLLAVDSHHGRGGVRRRTRPQLASKLFATKKFECLEEDHS